jgi:SSS family solute:Na+ symporter
MNWLTVIVFLSMLLAITVLGFVAARWRSGDLARLQEWGMAGRRFGTLVSWFLLGGDVYTSYTFIAVPALLFSGGAFGFFAVPYTILAYPLMFFFLPRFWTISRHRGYVTAADFVQERFGSRPLAFCIAATGILAMMPYIALQMLGIQIAVAQLGLPVEAALLIAFLLMASYTYTSGLRAPALIAMVKDISIWIVVGTALIVIPLHLGGMRHVFASVPPSKVLLSPAQYSAYATLALGSAGAVFLYPHSLTGLLSSNSRQVVRRNASFLPLYSLTLGLIALLGYIALAAHIPPTPGYQANSIVPALFATFFPDWFTGFALAALTIGALVPAAIMSIAAANLFTRTIYHALRPTCTEQEEGKIAKAVSLLVKVGALAFVLFLPSPFAINFQLLGGVWMLQTLPSVFIGLYTNWFHRRALILGWVAGMGTGTWMAFTQHFQSSVYPLSLGGLTIPVYAAVAALAVNSLLTVLLTPLCRMVGIEDGIDATQPADYEARPVVIPDLPTGQQQKPAPTKQQRGTPALLPLDEEAGQSNGRVMTLSGEQELLH